MQLTATTIDRQMIGRALALARRASTRGEVPVGAVVYRHNQILAEAHNLRETEKDPTAHAEIVALRAAAMVVRQWRLDGCSLAVTLEPCPMCAGAMVNARIERLVYGAPDPKMGCANTLYELCTDTRFNHRLTVIGGVLAEPCAEQLRRFFQDRRGDNSQ